MADRNQNLGNTEKPNLNDPNQNRDLDREQGGYSGSERDSDNLGGSRGGSTSGDRGQSDVTGDELSGDRDSGMSGQSGRGNSGLGSSQQGGQSGNLGGTSRPGNTDSNR